MKTYKLNRAKSKAFYAKVKKHMLVKDCYRNIFRSIATNHEAFVEGDLRIAYGYMQSVGNIYVRHCFILDKEGDVIDPTIYAHSDEAANSREREYVPFAVLELEQYTKLLEANSYYPDLCNLLRDEDTAIMQEAFKEGLLFVG